MPARGRSRNGGPRQLTTAGGEAIDPREIDAELEGRSAERDDPLGDRDLPSAAALRDLVPEDRHGDHGPRARRSAADAKFFYLDTDVLFEETYATRDALAHHYGIEFERYSGISLQEQEDLYGANLWDRQPDACCGIRKVEPMREALSGIDCWVSGIRREDSTTRAGAAKFGWDRRFGLWKLNPLADWTEAEIWDYINDKNLPYNPLHDAGYPSIGCTHCTRPPGAGGHPRSGRWADAHKTECGLHG